MPVVALDQLVPGVLIAPATSGKRRQPACRRQASAWADSTCSAVCTSENALNICCSSGRLVNFANRLLGFSPAPSGEISIVSMTSPNVAAQASKCSMPRLRKPSGSRKRCMVYISIMVFDMGVPVAKVTP